MRRQRNVAQMKEQIKTPENSIRCRVQNPGYEDAQGTQ